MRCVHTFIASQYNQIGSCKLQCWEGGGGGGGGGRGEGLVKCDIISYRGGMKCDGGGGGGGGGDQIPPFLR